MMARGRYGIFLLAILSSTLWAQPLCECFQISQVTTAKCATRMLLPKLTSTHVDGLRANRNRHFTCSVNNHDQQLLPTGRWHVYRSRSSITTSRASAREGNEVSGEREEDENQPESSPDAISADELDSSREKKMEMRDFRQKLLAKGLDGWGVENNGDTDEKGEQATGDDERWAHPLVRPELGCLVLANQSTFTQQQQYFYCAVILVIQHDVDGTVGLILNRPTTFTMGDVCKGNLYRVPGMEDNVLYMGGDVAGARDDGLDVVNLMHGREDVPGIEVMKGLRLGGLKEALDMIAKGEAEAEEFKFFSRYAGWGPGQLEAEVLAKAWVLAACDLPSILKNHTHPDQPGHFWNEIMSRLRRHREKEGEAERRRNSS